MATKLTDISDLRSPQNRYDWATWFDGAVWQLTEGEDFQVNPADFRTIAYAAARRAGLKVSVHLKPGGVLMQAHQSR